jgi:hypothetical protein
MSNATSGWIDHDTWKKTGVKSYFERLDEESSADYTVRVFRILYKGEK